VVGVPRRFSVVVWGVNPGANVVGTGGVVVVVGPSGGVGVGGVVPVVSVGGSVGVVVTAVVGVVVGVVGIGVCTFVRGTHV